MDSGHNDQQRDFMSNLFPMDHSSLQTPPDSQFSFDNLPSSNQQTPAQFGQNNSQHQQPLQNLSLPYLDMDALSNLLPNETSSMTNSTAQLNNMMLEQYRLSQLQQLQALQQKIIQHQIQLLSGQLTSGPSTEMHTDVQTRTSNLHGLPTPVSSVEMRPQPAPEFVTPLNLHQYQHDMQNLPSYMSPMVPGSSYPSHSQQQPYHRGTSSAPAHIAFRKNNVQMDMDLDISPLTSPWLGADPVVPRLNKRTASPSGDESARKKTSPAIGPSNPAYSSGSTKKPNRVSKSASTSQYNRSRRNSIVGEHDTPSPVEMPPPAQPLTRDTSDGSIPPSPVGMTPVTPASIMNLGKLAFSSSLVPPQELSQQPVDPKPRSLRARASSTADSATKQTRPTKKTTPQKPQAVTPSPNLGPTQPAVRKTSHKAAEQKRRDSLKTTFDELRNLLPPIPLPSDDKTSEERALPPGALPPRGPPKAGVDGPNKAVSKLQLLICGNEYIRQLNGRVERRDVEIAVLRKEIIRLRTLVNMDDDGGGDIDLEKDLDAVEALSSDFGKTHLAVTAEEDEDVGED